MSVEDTNATNLKYAYQCAVETHKKFEEQHSLVKGATLNFELISGVEWFHGGGDVIWLEGEEEYGFEVNFVVYEDDFCIHFDCDDGCGNHHIDVVFLKSEQKRFEDLNED